MRPVSARIAVSSGLFRASMKASTAPGLVDAVVVFVAHMVTTWLPTSGVWPALCLAVEDNGNVRQDSTNVIVFDCEEPNGKTWKLDRSRSSGRSWFQIKYTGPTKESFDLCVAGQRPGGSGTVWNIKSRVAES